MQTFQQLLTSLGACSGAKQWAVDKTIEQVVNDCHRGDWLLWLSKKIDLPLNKLTLAKARCAKTVIHLMKDWRSVNAVKVAERFGLDECTLDELNAAAYAAYAAAYAAAAAADADAAYAADAAAYAAAAAAAADAAAYAAYAAAAAADADAYAAYADDAAADAAAYAAYADDAAADAAAAARTKNQLQTADICREILGQLIIDKVNLMLL